MQTTPVKCEAYLALKDGAVVQLVRVCVEVQQHTQHIARRCSGGMQVLSVKSYPFPLTKEPRDITQSQRLHYGDALAAAAASLHTKPNIAGHVPTHGAKLLF